MAGGQTSSGGFSGSLPTATDSSTAMGSSSVPQRLVPQNARGNKADVGWKYGISVQGTVKIQCKFCQKVFNGGVYRLKHHLAKTNQNVEACKFVPDDVNKEMMEIITSLMKKTANRNGSLEIGEKRKAIECDEIESARIGQLCKKRGVGSQATINSIFKKGIREDACQAIARFFYNNAIAFNVARSEEFPAM
ncbi:uncharacterized protein LOC113866016 [Abrus precatorius]|uniref:Uncharacterized protein LOC113866016 n=1 Tax=Abrus precatorius TaxID=3816 RepID=A0A8B8LPA0_ABRPR|nr:uncharacterized protein LOC113866016 [Abrus precatorius]